MIEGNGALVRFPEATVFVRETGEGEPLLLINGLAAHSGMWGPLEHTLEGFHIVEFDLPGAGQSPIAGIGVSMPDLARLASRVMDEVAMKRADVLGYSMGGMIAQQFTADMPERVRRLVLAATSPGVGAVQVDLRALANILTPARYSSPTIWAKSIGSLVGGRARYDKEWIAEQAKLRFDLRPSWRGYMGQMRSMSGWSGLPLLPTIDHPTLVISGGDDPLSPVVNGKMIAHQLPNGRHLVLPGEGHLMVTDENSAAHAYIREYLTSDPLESSAVWNASAPVSLAELGEALAAAGRQIPPLNLLDIRARRRWLERDGASA